jgi:hypothetical protein
MSKFEELKEESYVGLCKLDNEQKNIINKNPHCAEFF